MSIVNRRHAVLGWLTWLGIKSIARNQAKAAVPAVKEKRPNKAAKVAAGAAAAGGVLLVWKRKKRAPAAGPSGGDDAAA